MVIIYEHAGTRRRVAGDDLTSRASHLEGFSRLSARRRRCDLRADGRPEAWRMPHQVPKAALGPRCTAETRAWAAWERLLPTGRLEVTNDPLLTTFLYKMAIKTFEIRYE